MRTFDKHITTHDEVAVEKNNIFRYKTIFGKAIQHFWYVFKQVASMIHVMQHSTIYCYLLLHFFIFFGFIFCFIFIYI